MSSSDAVWKIRPGGRILRTDYGDWSVLNCYFPFRHHRRYPAGLQNGILADFHRWVKELRQELPQTHHCRRLQISPILEIDIHDPVRNKNNSGFLPEEREWMSQWFDNGFVMLSATSTPDKVEYSWWTYRAGTVRKIRLAHRLPVGYRQPEGQTAGSLSDDGCGAFGPLPCLFEDRTVNEPYHLLKHAMSQSHAYAYICAEQWLQHHCR